MKKRIIALLLAFMLAISCLPINAFANNESDINYTDTTIYVESVHGKAGSTVDVNVNVENNAGIAGAKIIITYDSKLNLISAESGEAFEVLDYTAPASLASPVPFNWDSLDAETTENGTVLKLTFEVSAEAKGNEKLDIKVSYSYGDIYTSDLDSLAVSVVDGYVNVIDYIPGDVNDDGVVNGKDVTLIRRYNANYQVNIKKEAANVNDDGVINGKDVTLIRRYNAGYDVTLVPETPKATPTNTPTSTPTPELTATPTPKPNEVSIIYHYATIPGDTYLETAVTKATAEGKIITQEVKNVTYESYKLPFIKNETIPGYAFQGWQASTANDAEKVEHIAEGTIGVVELYAKWTKTPYQVTFVSPLVPQNTITRTIDQTTPLEKLSLDGYTFMGWSDDNGNVISDYVIKPGTKAITLHANWTSNRNLTRPSTIGDPIIHFDESSNKILFAYEIGTVENIPLYDLGYYDYIMTPTDITETVTKSITIDETAAKAISQAISNATTKTSAWTLSNEWTNSSSISEEHLNEMDSSTSSDWTTALSESGTYNISTSEGGATTTVVEAGVSAKVGTKVSREMKVGFPIDVLDVEGKVSTEISAEVGAELSTSQSDTKTWNTNEGYSASKEASSSHSLSSTLAQKISDSVSYNISKSTSESTTNTWSTADTSTESREYASTFTYATTQFEEKTYTKTLKDAPAGHYRLVAAGTAHVFAVVTYDIATNAYGIYTYSIMEDEVKPFLDYSKETSRFDDNENGVLNFEVPYYVNRYVDSIVGATDGFVVDPSNGIIEEYNGTDNIVVIPQYIPVDNGDNTVTVVKVKGITSNTFSENKNIKAVQMNSFIDEIPASAFELCSNLVIVQAPAVTNIGTAAFKNCTSLKEFTVSKQVTYMGPESFKNVESVTVNAGNVDVASAAINCGAKRITLNMAQCKGELSNTKIKVQSNTEYFAFMGGTKTYTNVTIDSKANTTVINGANFVNSNGTVLRFDSENVTLNRVNVRTNGWTAVFEAENTNLLLQGEVYLDSNGTNSVLSRNITLTKVNPSVASTMKVQGNMMVCGSVQGTSYLSVNGTLEKNISQDVYYQLLIGTLDWVLADEEVPEDAVIVSEKWTYDLTTNITSDQVYIDGYTLYNTTSIWGEYGAWSEWSTTEATASDSREVETNSVAATYKTQYNYSRWTQYANGTGHNGPWEGAWSGIWCGNYKEKGWSDSPLSVYSNAEGFPMYGSAGNTWYNQTTRQVEVTPAYTEYRYRDRELIYTYYHTKTETMESATEVAETESISNVKKWVQYIVD